MKNRRVGRILVAGVALLAFAGGARDIARAIPVAPAAVSVAAIDPSSLHWYPPMVRTAAIDPSSLHWYPPMARTAAIDPSMRHWYPLMANAAVATA